MSIKMGRNDQCYCGSNKKYKKCCLNDEKTPCYNNHGYVSALSRQIFDLVADYLEEFSEIEVQQKIISFACCAWNLASLDLKDRQNAINEMMKMFNTVDDDREVCVFIINDMIQKKLILYHDDKRLIKDFEIIETKGGFHLNVISMIPINDY